MIRSLSYTERRRARLALKFGRLDQLETRNTITEPISVTALSLTALRGLAQLGIMQADGGNGDVLARARAAQWARQGPVRRNRPCLIPINSHRSGGHAPAQAAGGGGFAQEVPSQTPAPDTLNPATCCRYFRRRTRTHRNPTESALPGSPPAARPAARPWRRGAVRAAQVQRDPPRVVRRHQQAFPPQRPAPAPATRQRSWPPSPAPRAAMRAAPVTRVARRATPRRQVLRRASSTPEAPALV